MKPFLHILFFLLVGNLSVTRAQIAAPDDILEGGVLFGIVKDGITKADVELDFTIDDNTNFVYDPATGTLTATTGDGKTHDIPLPAAAGDQMGDENVQPDTFKELTVRDADGNLYKVEQTDPDNPAGLTATQIGKVSETLTAENFNPKKLDREQAVVTFRKGAGYYAFDTWQGYYEKAYLIRDKYENLNMIYRVPWKLLPQGKSDVIEATVEIKDKTIDPAKVVFKTPKGVEFKSDYQNGVYTIQLVGGTQGDGQEIYATYKSGSQYLNFGKLSVASYAEQTYKAVIVPVYDTPIDIEAIHRTLKDIYGPVGIHWEVSEEKGYTYNGAKFFEGKSGLLNSYTPEMRAMNADFVDVFKNGVVDPQTNYIFVLKYSGRAMERDAAGFMPRGGQFGYIFTKDFQSDNEILQTIAHELGHGKLLLKHTFDKDYGIAQGTTDNLMDYAQSKTHLAKWQWDVLADPGIAQGVFDRDEDGMMKVNTLVISQLIEQIRQCNKEKKTIQTLKLVTNTETSDKITLGKKDYSYIKIETTGFNTLLDRKPTMTVQTNNGPVTLPAEMPSYDIAPSELSRSVFSENNTRYVKYQFHELQENISRLNIKEPTGNVRIGITVKESESESFEEYLYPVGIFLESVTWVSQFDESIFGLCTGCWKVREVNGRTYVSNSCCRRATEYMMGNTNIANCTDSIIAQSAPYMSVRGRINTATFSDNTSRYTSDTYNAAILNYQSETITDAVRYVKNELKNGRPVLIGVHYISNGRFSPPNNTNRATRHFMVVVGMGLEGEREYFRFYEPGRKLPEQTDATSPNNKLYIDHQQGFIQGIYDDRTYTITEIVKHN